MSRLSTEQPQRNNRNMVRADKAARGTQQWTLCVPEMDIWGGCKLHVDMSATTTVALPTKREQPHCRRECSHKGTPVEHHFQIETS
jgi:hypothetical protein